MSRPRQLENKLDLPQFIQLACKSVRRRMLLPQRLRRGHALQKGYPVSSPHLRWQSMPLVGERSTPSRSRRKHLPDTRHPIGDKQREIVFDIQCTCMFQSPGIKNLPVASTTLEPFGTPTLLASPMSVMRLPVMTTVKSDLIAVAKPKLNAGSGQLLRFCA